MNQQSTYALALVEERLARVERSVRLYRFGILGALLAAMLVLASSFRAPRTSEDPIDLLKVRRLEIVGGVFDPSTGSTKLAPLLVLDTMRSPKPSDVGHLVDDPTGRTVGRFRMFDQEGQMRARLGHHWPSGAPDTQHCLQFYGEDGAEGSLVSQDSLSIRDPRSHSGVAVRTGDSPSLSLCASSQHPDSASAFGPTAVKLGVTEHAGLVSVSRWPAGEDPDGTGELVRLGAAVLLDKPDAGILGGSVQVLNRGGQPVCTMYVDPSGAGEIGAWNSKGLGRTLTPSTAAPPAPVSDAIESRIDGDFDGLEEGKVFKLVNGQIWEQTSFEIEVHIGVMPKVLIYKSDTVWKLRVDGCDRTPTVRRLK